MFGWALKHSSRHKQRRRCAHRVANVRLDRDLPFVAPKANLFEFHNNKLSDLASEVAIAVAVLVTANIVIAVVGVAWVVVDIDIAPHMCVFMF